MNSAQSACERLTLSRDRLRQALSQEARPAQDEEAGPFGRTASRLFAAMQSTTATRFLASVLKSWWHRHPLRLGLNVSAQAVGMVAAPVVQNHPVALVMGSALVGALLVRTRAWRLLPVSALFAGLAPQLIKALASHHNP